MSNTAETPYGSTFYKQQSDGSFRSAQVILELLYRYVKPRSVIDIGCGTGAWLTAAERLGSQELKGLDGIWVDVSAMRSPAIEFTPIDFERPIPLERKYDLCMSLEVAEHVSESRAAAFVETLCTAADVVLFSAAIKYQEGTAHINEQWQSYWVREFDARGFQVFDIVRPAVWSNDLVEWWYRQNTLVFVRRQSPSAALFASAPAGGPIIDLVHPRNYEVKQLRARRNAERPTLTECVRYFGRYLRVKASRLAGGG